MPRKHRKRVIDQLRELFPGGAWVYCPLLSRWVGRDFSVYGISTAYDESAGTHIVRYVRDDTHEYVAVAAHLEICG